ncbi:MAG TPA: LCP family protein [Dermatophilaceae bacterium]
MTEQGSGDEQARPDSAALPEVGPSRHAVRMAQRRANRHPRLRRASIIVAAGLVLLLTLGTAAYVKLNSNITKYDVSKLLGQRPNNNVAADKLTNLKPLNILVIGSDTRDLGTSSYGTTAGARSDTTLIVHLSGDRKSAVVVSVPRDSMTRAPANCKDPKSKVADGPIRQWNANYSLGGPACLIRTVEGTTGIFIDHFMVMNFLGFQSMVDALGSVEVCMPTAVVDPLSGLNLPAGRSRVTGKEALAFVRVRHNMGDGSDLGRIDRQQAFLSSMIQEATSTNLLLRPDKLFRFLDAATKSLTTDPALGNLNALREVAQSVVGLKSSQIRFVTVPVEPYPPDHNRVQWTSAADALWKSIREDTPLPGTKPAPGSKPTPTTTSPPPVLTVTPDKITVHVSNDSGVPGIARQAADDLRLQGFKINGISNDSSGRAGATVTYSAANHEQALTVAAAFPGAVLVEDSAAGDVIRVSLGTGSPNVVAVPNRLGTTPLPTHTLSATAAPTPSSTVTIQARTADTNICKK